MKNQFLTYLFKARSGMAATEFAFIAPVMISLFFGAIEARTAHYTGDRVHQAASIMADVSAKESAIAPEELDDLMIGVENIIAPLKAKKLTLNIVSVIANDNGKPIVHWSRSNKESNREPYSPGARFRKLDNDDVLLPGYGLIYAEVKYNHKSGLTGRFLDKTLKIRADKIRLPRKSSRVSLCEYNESDDEYENCV
ncbi:MAG: TadE/TadG family type IV pilus assembly protein [Pseudomonadota bacterium]